MSHSEIHFSTNTTLKSFENFSWTIGNFYKIEFFDGILTPIIIFNANSNIDELIYRISSSDETIFFDLTCLNSNNSSTSQKNEQIFLFTFCFQSAVYNILQTKREINQSIKQLFTNDRLRFCVINAQRIKSELVTFFESNFEINLEDFSEENLSSNKTFKQIINERVGQPKIDIEIDQIFENCDTSKHIIPQIIPSSYKMISISIVCSGKKSENFIQFSSKLKPEDLQDYWNVGESYNIEFFEGVFTPVHLIDINSDLTEYFQRISNEKTIFLDFKCVQSYIFSKKLTPEEQKEVPYICLFSFYCSSGVYIFKQTTLTANEQMKEFLSNAQKDHKFVGINLESALKRLHSFFGSDFSFTIEDVSKTRLSQKLDPSNFYDLVVKYFKQPIIEFNNKNIKNAHWHKNPLSMTLIIYAAFKVYSLSLCYPNFPSESQPEVKKPNMEPVKKQPEVPEKEVKIYSLLSPSEIKSQPQINKKGEIHLASITDFDSFYKQEWIIGDSYDVEFFSGILTSVFLLDAASDISEYVKKMEVDSVIFIDFEYVMESLNAAPVCLFQFCCSSGAFLFKQTRIELNEQMKKFLDIKSGHKFVGKGINGDIHRLKQFFGDDFEINLEDVEQTRLYSYDESANFDQMVLKYAGKPEANFKDKKVSRSNWNAKNYSMKQVLYSAFDVVSLYKCFPSFPPLRYIMFTPQPYHPNRDIKKKFNEFLKQNKGITNDEEIESNWNSNPNLVAEMIGIDLNIFYHVVNDSMRVTIGHKFSCKLCNRSVKCLYFINLVIHYLNYHLNDEKSQIDEQINFKSLFCVYLYYSGRVIFDNNSCILCGSLFDSKPELENHCWNHHFNLLNEFFDVHDNQKNKSKKGKKG